MSQLRYFQFHKKKQYPVLLSVKPLSVDEKYLNVLLESGFEELEQVEIEKLSVLREKTTVIHLEACAKKSEKALNLLEQEGINDFGDKYLFRLPKSGALLFGRKIVRWSLSITSLCEVDDFQYMLNKATSLALSKLGVLSFWGVVAKNMVVLTSKEVSESGVVMIDFSEKKLISAKQVWDLDTNFSFARLELVQSQFKREMQVENAFAFFVAKAKGVSEGLFSVKMRESLLSLALDYKMYSYPLDSFSLGSEHQFIESNKDL